MKTNSPLKQYLVLMMALVCVVFSTRTSSAQTRLSGYTTTPFSAPWTSIIGQSGTINYGMANNISGATGIGMPFNFTYDGALFTAGSTIWLNSGGSINFGSGVGTYYDRIVVYFSGSATSYPTTMGVMSGLQYVRDAVYYQVSGAVGSRVMTVEWSNCQDYWTSSPLVSYQIKLYEATSAIEFIYRDYNAALGGSQASYYHNVGLNGNTSPSFQQIITINGTTNFNTPSTNYRYSIPPPVQLSSSPKTLNFGQVFVGNSPTLNVTVKNVGTGEPLTFTSAFITGSSDFSIVAGTPIPNLAIGASANITVRFAPTGNGARTAVLTIVSNGKDSAIQTINLLGDGLAPNIAVDSTIRFKRTRTKMGQSYTQWVKISDVGKGVLAFNSFVISGSDADQYSISYYPPNFIPSNGTDSLGITFTPTREGIKPAVLTINSNAANTPILPIQLLGTGIIPKIVVTPTTVMFDSVGQGDTLCKSFAVYNPGSDTLFILKNQSVSGEGDFIPSPLTGTHTVIPPDRTEIVNVCFAPRQAGLRAARYVLTTNIINTFEQPRRDTASTILIDFTGTGVPYGVFSQSLPGGTNDSALVGTPVCAQDTIRNNGDADILIKSWSISGTDKADFAVSGITLPYTLKARSFVAVNICGTPADKGVRNATLTINGTSNGRNLTISSPLKVYGLNVCATPAPTALFTDQKVLENNDSTMCVTVTNCGNIPATYTATLPNGTDYTLVAPTTSPVVAPGATATFCVKFHPTTMGTSTGSMVISSANLADISVPLTGVGACAVVTAPAATIPVTNAGGHTPFTVTINNGGNYDWTPGTPVVTPNDGVFTIGALANVPAGGNIQPTLTYNPTDVNKLYTAKITFPNATPACASALEINLSQQTGATSVRQITEQNGFVLGQNYPNPFGSATSFNYSVPNETVINLTISDVTGKLVKTITTGRISAGEHNVTLDASELASGTYVVTLTSEGVSLHRQIVVAR